MHIDIFFDYTCQHSFALHRLLMSHPRGGLEVKWRTLCLKEFRRVEGNPSVLSDPEDSFSVLALTLAHGVDRLQFAEFHNSVFERVHAGGHEMSKDDLFELAEDAGLSRGAFQDQRSLLTERLVADHQEAMDQWKAHGTPTIVFEGKTAFYSKFSLEDRPPSEALDLIMRFAKTPWLLELKRSI